MHVFVFKKKNIVMEIFRQLIQNALIPVLLSTTRKNYVKGILQSTKLNDLPDFWLFLFVDYN